MKKRILLMLILVASTLLRAEKSEKLRALLHAANIPGIQLIHAKNGQTEAYNIGKIGDDTREPVTSHSIFEAGSLSKTVFAYTVLRLADRGIIALDTPLLRYIGGTYERFDSTNSAYEKITARMVLRHTTGFRNWADDGKIPLLFPPDSCFNYSGQAYMFLLTVLERVTHQNLEQLAQAETFIPLGMKNSSFRWNAKFAGVSTFGSDSAAIANHNELNSASSLLTNASDYAIFLNALLSGRGLKPSTHAEMLSLQTKGNWFNHPVVEAVGHVGWGLGVGIQLNEKGKALWQWGENGNYKAFYIAYPANGEFIVYFTNDWRGLYITQQIVDLFMGQQTTWVIPWLRNGYYYPYDIGYEDAYAVGRFEQKLKRQGYAKAEAIFSETRKNDPSFKISEKDLQAYADILLEKNEKANTLAILKLNVTLHPQSANALAGLAKGYHLNGDDQRARLVLKKCLVIEPANPLAVELEKELSGEKK